MSRLLTRISSWIIIVTVAITPLLFLPFTQDYYETNKSMFLIIIASVLLIVSGVRMLLSEEIKIKFSPALLGFFALISAVGISTVFASANKVEALLAPYGLLTMVALGVMGAVGLGSLTPQEKTKLSWAFIGSASLAGLIAVYQFIGIGKALSTTLPFLAEKSWTPVASSSALIAVLITGMILALTELIPAVQKRSERSIIGGILCLILVSAGLVTTFLVFLPSFRQQVLPLAAGWAIALEVLKNLRSMFFGVGIENYIAAFSTGRPVWLNTTDIWSTRYGLGSTYVLHLLSTTGLAGSIALVVFYKTLLSKKTLFLGASIMGLTLVLAPSIGLLVSVLTLLFVLGNEKHTTKILPAHFQWVRIVGFVVCLIVSLTSLFFIGKSYAAELTFSTSLNAARNNDGSKTYNALIQTINLNPSITRYHLAYSQTNLLLANSISQNATKNATPGAQISDSDRQTVATLTQQAIREAKIATNLSPTSVIAWENLAAIYQNLIGVAQGADQWTIATLQKSIQLDPTNPALRFALASVYTKQGNEDGALTQLLSAMDLKPDYPAAAYAIAKIYENRKDNLRAAFALQAVISMLPDDNKDKSRVQKELDDIKKLLTKDELTQFIANQSPPSNASVQDGLTPVGNASPTPMVVQPVPQDLKVTQTP